MTFESFIPDEGDKYIFCMNFKGRVINLPFDEFARNKEDVGVWKIAVKKK